MGGVTGDEQLQLLVQVTQFQVDAPGADSCRREKPGEFTFWFWIHAPAAHPDLATLHHSMTGAKTGFKAG